MKKKISSDNFLKIQAMMRGPLVLVVLFVAFAAGTGEENTALVEMMVEDASDGDVVICMSLSPFPTPMLCIKTTEGL